ncbi:uncharacterized protein LOC125859043 [Solanum stenotomum]|uniref:uncharacterized protein LOC125859043 n=1 Tax=Solanum stenotomum TaxID=172797 RepID=UPI0020D15211|nr:uncharacterized protein LOC125859043 [Solanum stenotomum]
MGSMAHVEDEKKELVRDVHRLACLGVQLVDFSKGKFMVHHSSQSSIVVDVKFKKHLDPILMDLKELVLNKFVEAFSQWGDGVLSYHSSIAMTPFQALYGRRCRSPVDWFEVVEFSLIGPDLVYDAIEKVQPIRERLKMAQSRKKSYAENRRRDLQFEIGNWVYLKISPMKGVMRFVKKEKLSHQYVGPYQILKYVGNVAYELDLPSELAPVHPVFHVSILRKCIGDLVSILPLEGLGVDENLSYKEVPVEILDRQVGKLMNKEVVSVKVLWRNHLVEGATWEAKANMKSRYPYLFPFTPTPT